MFLNILRISASNVLKMSLNIIVSVWCTFVIFHLHKPTESINAHYYLGTSRAGEKAT